MLKRNIQKMRYIIVSHYLFKHAFNETKQNG